jgi:hypothetical protein
MLGWVEEVDERFTLPRKVIEGRDIFFGKQGAVFRGAVVATIAPWNRAVAGVVKEMHAQHRFLARSPGRFEPRVSRAVKGDRNSDLQAGKLAEGFPNQPAQLLAGFPMPHVATSRKGHVMPIYFNHDLSPWSLGFDVEVLPASYDLDCPSASMLNIGKA